MLAAKEVPEVTAVKLGHPLEAGYPLVDGHPIYPSLGYSNMGYSSMGYPAGNPYGYSGYPAVNPYGYSGYPGYSTPYPGYPGLSSSPYSGYPSLPTTAGYFKARLAPASPYTPYMPANSYIGVPKDSSYMGVPLMSSYISGPKAGSYMPEVSSKMGVRQTPQAPSSQFHAQDEMGNLNYGYSNINSAKVTPALHCRV